MMKDFKYSGSWWLPHSQKQVTGDLTFSNQDGLRLDLHDFLVEGRSFFENAKDKRLSEFPIVLGMTKDGKLITLCDCVEVSVSMTVKNIGEGSISYSFAAYDAQAALVGAHFTDTQEMRFHRADIQYDYLPDFVRKHGFIINFETKEGQEYQYTYEYPSRVVATTSRGSVCISYTFHQGGNPLNGLILRQSTALEIRPQKELTLKDMDLQYLKPLQDLISLATNRANSITDLLVYSKEKVETVMNRTLEVPIEVAFQQVQYGQRQENLLPTSKLLFTLKDQVISDRFSEIIDRWLNHTNITAELKDVFYLFFSVLYDPDLSPDMEFLSLAFAAELYHRRRFSNELLPENEHKERKKSIINGAPEEHRRWLKDVLGFSNEPRFKNRVDELVEMTKPVVSPIFSDKDYFVKKVKDTRNYLVHKNPKLKKKAAEGEELYWTTKTLKYLVQTCLLVEVGLTSEDCFMLLSKNKDYKLALERAPTFGPQHTS